MQAKLMKAASSSSVFQGYDEYVPMVDKVVIGGPKKQVSSRRLDGPKGKHVSSWNNLISNSNDNLLKESM